jgi:hypothetical protein
MEFSVYREDNSPTSRMLFILPEGHGLKAGDGITCHPCYRPGKNDDYYNNFTITSVNDRVVDCGITYNIYNLTEFADGWIYKREDWKRLPITITDNNIEVKEKLTKPIEYSLNYMSAYSKTTLRG